MPKRKPNRCRYSPLVLCVFALLICEIPQRADGQCYYTWVEIPIPPGWMGTNGEAINSHGHVVGRLLNLGDNQRGFIWTPEGGTRVMPMPPGAYSLQPYDMNDFGHVVGLLRMPGHYELPFFWDGQNFTIIEIPAWANFGIAFGINNQDQVVGEVLNSGTTHPMRPFLWENGVFTELGASFGDAAASARAISEQGLIIGQAHYGGGRQRAFRLENGVAELLELPTGFEQSFGYGPNNAAEIVGNVLYHNYSDPDFRSEAIHWRSNHAHVARPNPLQSIDLFTISDAGRAAGGGLLPGSLLTRVAAYQNGVASDAQALMVPPPQPATGHPRYAIDINASGQIAAYAFGRSLVLTPVWLQGDLTGDCHVSFEDLSLVLVNFGAPAGSFPRGDVDLDGDVDLSDLAILLSNWGS